MQSIDETIKKKGGDEARKKVRAFFEKLFGEEKPKPILLTTMILSDGIGDLGMISFLHNKLKGLQLTVLPIVFCDAPRTRSTILQQIPDAQIIVIDSNVPVAMVATVLSSYMKGGYENCFVIVYPFTFQFSLKALADSLKISPDYLLGIKEMGLDFDVKTGYLGNGIGFGIPQWKPVPKIEGSFYPQWFISCKSYLATVSVGRDTKEDFFTRFQNITYMAQQLNISRLLFIVSKEVLSNVSKLGGEVLKCNEYYAVVKIQEMTIVLSIPLSKPILREYLDHTEQVIFSGGEALFVESLGANGEAVLILCPRYSFQCKELAHLLINEEGIEEVSLGKSKYQYFMDEKENLFFYDGTGIYDVLNNFKPCQLGERKLYANASLQAIGFCLFSTFSNAFPIKFYESYPRAYEQALTIYSKLKDKLKSNNWFDLIQKGSVV